jgi:iron complex outermembrane receptor protein
MKIHSLRAAVAAALANKFSASTFGVAALVLSGAALAQDAPAAMESATADDAGSQSKFDSIEEAETTVTVTGSRIVRGGYEAPTPLTAINAEDLQKSPDSSLLVALAALPALTGSQTNGVSHGRQGESLGGVQAINLRSLGSNRVLVLLDGARMAPATYTNFVDVSTVPSQLISRVDVVTGGASAVYGSDAVAGVVNFVLDREFTGVKSEISAGQTNFDDGENYKINLSGGFGFADGRGHVLLSGGLTTSDGTHGTDGDRGWNREGWGLMPNPAFTTTNGQPQSLFVPQMSSSNTTAGGIISSGPLKGTAFGPGGTPYQFQYGPILGPTSMAGGGDWQANSTKAFDDLDPKQSSYNFFGRVGFDVTDNINVFAQASYGRSTVEGPFGSSLSRNDYLVRLDNAYLPTSVRDRMVGAGVSSFVIGSWNQDMPKGPYSNRRDMSRITAGVEGEFTAFDSTWNWNAAYAYGRADISLHNKSIIISRAKLALDAVVAPNGNVVCRSTLTDPNNGCLPWNFMGTGVNDANLAAGAFEYLTDGGQWQDGLIEQTSQSVSLTGEPFSLWAGAVSLAGSFEHRTDKIDSVVDQFSANSLRTGSNYAPLSGEQSVSEAAFEAIIPLAKGATLAKEWDLSLAARETDYEHSGLVTTWKVGTTYSPFENITIRATRSRDIRAPNIRDLFASPAGFGGGAVDRFQNNAPVVGGFFTVQGNPDLKPEKADTTGLGIVLRPGLVPGFAASVDYWRVNIKDAIQELQAQDVVDACFYGIDASACPRIERGTDGNITFIRSAPLNLAKYDARGIDVEASYRLSLSKIVESWPGSFSLHGFMTFYLQSVQQSPFSPRVDVAGSNFFATSGAAANSLPDWKLNLTAEYQVNRWSFSLTGRAFADGEFNNTNGMYVVCTSNCPPVTVGKPTINYNSMPGRVYLDANVSYGFEFAEGSSA